ncbi:MAG: ATP-binding protein [Nitrospira sp.]|nr:ATP-binding protein [Nitrospira sp.]
MNQDRKWKGLSYGPPKGSGKSTFWATAPGTKLVLQYDLGASTFPPGSNPNDFWIQTYPDLDSAGLKTGFNSDKWARTKEVYAAVVKDLDAIVEGFKAGNNEITLHDGTKVPLPDTLILDGLVRLDNIIVDGFCAINNIKDPGDAMDAKGKVGGGVQKFWGRRLSVFNKLFTLAISLPCHVGAITWEDVKTASDGQGGYSVVSREPDVGGKLNVWSPGMFDACLYHCNLGGKFMVRTQPTGEIQRVGVRNTYGMDPLIDVTIDPKNPGEKSPFSRVFDVAATKLTEGK